ncbi:hypothetical protein B9Z55_018697 [Caenorhabditis nigoni]|uniref:G-protein coupled receptors family 1 profile domain-containing protein n=1 Tax=Caenorhabditis nigoni TaxID=1611254 RepID=A0A2G5TFC5_9PELO|nr:hypothetical protein B9Z55_018697 [Caenorhabditis nigoni]
MDSQTLNRYIIASYKLFFLVVGIIGNVLFIHLVFKRKQLQSRTAILQCVQAAFHIICQTGPVMSGVFDMGAVYTRVDCFHRIAYYIFFQAAQGMIMLVIVLDILIFVKFPVFYRRLSVTKYVVISGSPILLFASAYVIFAHLTTNEETVSACTPPFVYSTTASMVFNQTYVALSIVVLLFYIILINAFYTRSRNQSSNRSSLKTVKRLQLTVIIFIFTWFTSQLLSFIVIFFPTFSKLGGLAISHLILFVCLSYSNTFYVTMWRSKEYRDQFYSVWWPRWSPQSSSIAHHSPSVTLKITNSESMFYRRSPTQIES